MGIVILLLGIWQSYTLYFTDLTGKNGNISFAYAINAICSFVGWSLLFWIDNKRKNSQWIPIIGTVFCLLIMKIVMEIVRSNQN